MTNVLPIVCIPGLCSSPRLYAEQVPHLWTLGPVTVAQHTQHESMKQLAESILATAPDRFALIGLSMGGYVSFEIIRQAPERVVKLALLDTSARPDTPEQTSSRRKLIELAEKTHVGELINAMFPRLVHPSKHDVQGLRKTFQMMADETGSEGFIKQQLAIIGRADSRPTLCTINCPTLVIVGDSDELTPPAIAAEIANGITGAVLVTVPTCGHSSALEQPEFVTNALLDFLKD